LRQYTEEGTLKAFKQHIPRLHDLGVDILWFMPIHPISELNRKGELGSYYSVKDYKAVNPEFGTLADFKDVVKEAHEYGMKVIIDWVPNHTGCDNAWVTKHPDWYARNDKGEMFGPYDWTDVYKLDYSNRDMRKAMVDALKFWLKDADIDGFRCDVAGAVPVDFWDETRPQLAKVKSEIFLLAEATEPELVQNAFDMDYNWPMKDLFSEIAATSGEYSFVAEGKTEPAKFAVKHASAIDSLVIKQQSQYPDDSYLMNMITNHDLNSWEGTEFDRLGDLSQAFAVLSYTLPGMPLIYTGQETGMDRALQFFVKDKAPKWEPKNEYFEFYRRLNNLKHTRPELAAGVKGGKYERYMTTSNDILVFSRSKGNIMTIVGVNLGKEKQPLMFNSRNQPSFEGAYDWLNEQHVDSAPESLMPGEYFVYTITKR
jgi:glycosidase